ncbi:MAG: type I glyceraldehyde-3-phosphate dehydrogenase [Candidatus Liptonbacteria bacterium]
MKKAKIAINGFGRIGRLIYRQALAAKGLEVVAINDLGDVENLAYLLKYDTVYGRFPHEISADKTKNEIVVDKRRIKVLQVKDPKDLPWGDMQIDIAVESTGLFESFEAAKAHLAAGAKRVVLSAPAKDAEGEGRTVLVGINEEDLKKVKISSNASCTTNSIAPVIKILSEELGIEKAVLGTVHAITSTQNLADGPVRDGKDFRRGRAAGYNIAPSTTGAAIAVTRIIPELKDKFDGLAYRVPVPTGSMSDITFIARRSTTVEEVNGILSKAAKSARWQGILAVTGDQVVSSDIIGEPYGATVDLSLTKVIGGNLVKVISWYDNEYGYVATLIRHLEKVAQVM